MHIGSQLTNLAPFEKAYLELLELADSLALKGDVPVLDLGGGLGIDYQAIASQILPPMVHWSPVFSAIAAIGWGLSLAGYRSR